MYIQNCTLIMSKEEEYELAKVRLKQAEKELTEAQRNLGEIEKDLEKEKSFDNLNQKFKPFYSELTGSD
jgi:hypothetical protein